MSDTSMPDLPPDLPPDPTPDRAPEQSGPDLDGIEADLADVEHALARLDSGEYWRDEVTGNDIPDEVLAVRPTTRRTSGA